MSLLEVDTANVLVSICLITQNDMNAIFSLFNTVAKGAESTPDDENKWMQSQQNKKIFSAI